MKIIFLDFDGVMDTAYYDHLLSKEGKPGCDEYGCIFDPACIKNLKYIIDYFMSACILARKYNRFEYLDYCISLFKELIDEQDGIIKTFDEYYIFNDSLLGTMTCYNISSYKNINEYIKFYDYLFNSKDINKVINDIIKN